MAWGQSGARGIDDLVRRISDNDPKLKSLTILRQRRFNHEDVSSLVRAMASNTHLTQLYASSHPLAPHTAALLADMLAASTNLQSLCVGDSSLGDDGVVALAHGIASSSLTHLDLSGKGLGVRGAEALAGALAAAGTLSHLNLSSNTQLADSGVQALCNGGDARSSPAPVLWAGLKELELQASGVTAVGVRALAASPNCGRLEVLRLDGNALGAAGGAALRELLQSANCLRDLSLRGAELEDEGGEALAGGLVPGAGGGEWSAARGTLTHLNLGECGLGPRTLSALRSAFTAGARLEVLNLAGNAAIGDDDVAGLAGGLAAAQAPALTYLDVSGSQAAAQGVEALSKVAGLLHLSLVGCPLGAAGAAALASSLSCGGWAALRELCISGAGISTAAMSGVITALAGGGGPNLKSVELGANPATQEDSFPELLETLRSVRPEVAVYWRSGDDPGPEAK